MGPLGYRFLNWQQVYPVLMLISVLVSPVLSAVAVLAVLRNDMRWIKEWCLTHERNDETRFKGADSARNDLRNDLIAVRDRVSFIEGRYGERS